VSRTFGESVAGGPRAPSFYEAALGEFILCNDDLRVADEPDAAVLAFLQDTYACGADLAAWPRRAFESPTYPFDRRPRHAWSMDTVGLPS